MTQVFANERSDPAIFTMLCTADGITQIALFIPGAVGTVNTVDIAMQIGTAPPVSATWHSPNRLAFYHPAGPSEAIRTVKSMFDRPELTLRYYVEGESRTSIYNVSEIEAKVGDLRRSCNW